jgi:hypothetical protein
MLFDLETGTHSCPLPSMERSDRKNIIVSKPARFFIPEISD